MKVESISTPENWLFLGEGGANIVFRLCKRPESSSFQDDPHAYIRKYNLESYVEIPQTFNISKIFTLALYDRALPYRHPSRVKLGHSPHDKVQVLSDYHLAPACADDFYSVEIKPKWHAALAFSKHKVDAHSALHHEICRYCNHNYNTSRVESPTPRYCPVDLFSQDEIRVRHAIECLCNEPRNNLRIFYKGLPISPHKFPINLRERLSKMLNSDPFLSILDSLLLKLWTGVITNYNELSQKDKDWKLLLQEAVIFRDCSFIVGLGCSGGRNTFTKINMIDIGPKGDGKMDFYISEVVRLREILKL